MRFILVLVLCLHTYAVAEKSRNGSDCGPYNKCVCKTASEAKSTLKSMKMDCSENNVTLKEVCNYIKHKLVTVLQIEKTNLGKIQDLDFRGCENVNSLILRNCGIRSINKSAFRRFRALTKLDISGNQLTDLYKGKVPAFLQPLNLLAELNIRMLTELDENSSYLSYPELPALKYLETLHIDGIPNRLFPPCYKDLKRLTTLIMSGTSEKYCTLGKLTNHTFQNVIKVENLLISHCGVLSVEVGTFLKTTLLKTLDISLNHQLGFEPLMNISYGLQFTKIDFLNYSYNYNTFSLGHRISKEDICYLRNTKLREFAVDGLKLQLIEANALLLLPETLEIFHVNDNVFTFGLYLLQTACIANIKIVEGNFQNFFHKPIQYVREVHNNDMQCREIRKSNCPFLNEEYLINVSKSIDNCVYYNQTPKSLLSMALPRELKKISFKDSNLNYKVGKVPILPLDNKVEYVDFSGNVAHDLVGPVGPLPALKHLNLSRNYCSYIGPNFFLYTINLEHLDLHKNFLGDLLSKSSTAEIFKPLKKLKSLVLSHNQIKELANNLFTHLNSLETLDLSYNSIDQWTLDVTRLQSIRKLLVRSNSLETLPASLTELLTVASAVRKISIDMTSNPIRYSCNNKPFLKWMAKHKHMFTGFCNYTFVDDDGHTMTTEMFRKKIISIDDMCRSFTPMAIFISIGITMVLSIGVSIILYVKRWTLRYYWYIAKRLPSGNNSYQHIIEYKFDAFVSHEDDNPDISDIINRLRSTELQNQAIKVCCSSEFRPGQRVAHQIHKAIEKSRKIVIVLCKDYIKDNWCYYTYNLAHEAIIQKRQNNMIFVLNEDAAPPFDSLPKDIINKILHKQCIEYNTSENGKKVFLKKLRESILQ